MQLTAGSGYSQSDLQGLESPRSRPLEHGNASRCTNYCFGNASLKRGDPWRTAALGRARRSDQARFAG